MKVLKGSNICVGGRVQSATFISSKQITDVEGKRRKCSCNELSLHEIRCLQLDGKLDSRNLLKWFAVIF